MADKKHKLLPPMQGVDLSSLGEKPRVIIGMPCTDIVRARTAHAIGCLIIEAGDIVVDFILKQSCEIASARTWLINEALRLNGTHLLFIDADICPLNDKPGTPFNPIQKMLDHKKPIVGTQYNMRKFPLKPVYESHHQEWKDKVSETELFEAQFAGTGFMLIDLAMIKDPNFGVGIDGKKTPWFSFGRDSQGAIALGEDAWFCFTARDSGYGTFIDPTIKVGHVGEYIF